MVAYFPVNMLVNTDSGCYTFAEYAEDLLAAGFRNPHLNVKHETMNTVAIAHKP
jgi:hypothetical protein